MVKTGNNIRIGRLHNKHSGYGALGGPIHPACHADLYEEVAPSFWRNLVTVPVDVLEGVPVGVPDRVDVLLGVFVGERVPEGVCVLLGV